MSRIAVTKGADTRKGALITNEVSRRLDAVRQRAQELFEKRGRRRGSAVDDWFAAERDVFGWPAAELKEGDDEFEMEVSLAGFEPSEIDVVAADDELVVHAVSKKQASGKDKHVVWTEFGTNDVYRRVALPAVIDPDSVTANYDNGLLKVHAPKAAVPA